MKKIWWLCCLCFALQSWAQQKAAYQLYGRNGKPVSYGKMLKAAEKQQVVLFGEYHDNAIAHWLELELAKDLGEKTNLLLGAEMFEADNQKALNNYLSGAIDEKQLDSTARLWPNFKTDYKPLVDLAKDKKWAFIATNIPRRFASLVYKKGFDALNTLTDEEKTWMMPLPVAYDPNLPGYVKMVAEMGGHGGENLPKAQAVKDATMAHFILANLKPGQLLLHFNGSYHSNNFEGIYWYLKKQQPNLDILTIATVTQADIAHLEPENQRLADFILVVDEDVTKTQ